MLIVIVHFCLSSRCPLIRIPAFETLTLPVSVYFSLDTRSSTRNVVWDVHQPFLYSSCFPLHSSVPVLSFTYRKELEQLQNP